MPVERILEAELAVEPKTESYGDMNMENSVCGLRAPSTSQCLAGLEMGKGCIGAPEAALTVLSCFLFHFFRRMTLSPTYATLLISSFSPSLNGPSASPTSPTSPWRTRSFCSGQVKDIEVCFSWDHHLGCHFEITLGIRSQVSGGSCNPSEPQLLFLY